MEADALSRLPTNLTEDSDFGDDLPDYAVADYHGESFEIGIYKQNPLTIQAFAAA